MKRFWHYSAVVGSMVLLAACGGDDENGGNADGDQGGNEADGEADEVVVAGEDIEGATELTFWTFAETHATFFENATERWNEENEDNPIQLTAEVYPFDQMHNNLLLSLQSGSGAPDLADIEIARFPNFLLGDVQLEPLNDLIDDELDNFITERLDIYGQDDTYYGAPTHLGATVMYYNTEIMDEAGVDIDEIVTWDDYIEAGQQVVEQADVPMTTISTNWYGLWPFVAQRGSDFFDENGELTLANDMNIETLQFVSDLVNEHEIAQVTPGEHNHSEEYFGFMNNGGAGSALMPLFYMSSFLADMPDLSGKMEIRPMPVFDESDARTVGMGGTGTSVTSQSDNVDLAKEFLYFAKMSYEGNINLWTELGFDPPRWDVWDDEELLADNEFYDYFHDDIFDILLGIRDEVEGVHIMPNTPDVLDEIDTNVMFNVIREQAQTPQEALEQAEESIRPRMDD
ncbi:ABC transporter substrate-binding protein [Salisediminibacterium beveridgei]|uniref:Sugar ABC transport system, sugar-binding protein n=1 Tax=Salisediminibacterium beveridgei TaxID=632773 RepID=A0A1D7QZ96_9BACI|nr:extracellular solute-binding protein [Salisediminibacterium beveridgei]AOM84323.1 sugar ABC transport system, sugar-binding protein [Salisediminibacterium beveridgei]